MRTSFVKASIVIFLLLWTAAAHATVYYVKNGGDDTLDGMSDATAWATCNKVNAMKNIIGPGDEILFNRGDTWNERLAIWSAGEENNLITFGAYGTGEKPIITGDPGQPAVRSYTAYIRLKDLHVKDVDADGVVLHLSNGSIIDGLTVTNTANNGISIQDGGDGIEIRNCEIYNPGNSGITLLGSTDNKISNVIVEDNYVDGAQGNDGISIHEGGGSTTAGTNFIIRNNTAVNCNEQGFDITSGDNVTLYNNVTANNVKGGVVVGHSAGAVTIKAHRSTDEPTQDTAAAILFVNCTSGLLKNSIIKGNGYHLLRIECSNVTIRNNDFIWNGGGEIMDIQGVSIENLTIENNLFGTMQNTFGRIRFADANRPPSHATFSIDYNIYHSPNGAIFYSKNTNTNYTFENYRTAFGQDANSYEADPATLVLPDGVVIGNTHDFDGGGSTTPDALAVSAVSATPVSGAAPLTVTFSVTPTGGTEPYTYAWDFGDGSTGTDQNPSHTYTIPGAYSAQVTVTDADMNTATGSAAISVQSGASACAVHAVFDASTNILTIPFLDVSVSLVDPISQQPTAEEDYVFSCTMEYVPNSGGSFSFTDITHLPSETADACHAKYNDEGTIYLPNVDVAIVVILPWGNIIDGPVETYEVTMKQMMLNPSYYHLSDIIIK